VSLTREDVQKLCVLARLEIAPDEMVDVLAKLSDIVGLVSQLEAEDTTDVVPMAHPLDQTQKLRSDQITETDEHQLYQKNAPLVEKDLYLVPKVIE
jgi:aspartyl-tRNA(Asn)/glutamyl-tRNA(Gln) amidotransferase subunit C